MSAKPQVDKSGRFAKADCWCNKVMRLPALGGGVMELEPDEFIPYEFTFDLKASGEEVDYLRSVIRLTDAEGIVWEGESIWKPSWFIERMTDFSRSTPPQPLDQTEAELVRALEENWFIRAARDLLDDRFYRELLLGRQRYLVPFKYQAARIDLASRPAGDVDDDPNAEVVVKVSGLYALAGEESRDQIRLPPIVFSVDVSERLFVNYLFEEDGGAWGGQEIPEMVTFRRSGLKGQPNEFVRVR